MKKKEKTFGAKLYSMFMVSILIPVAAAMLCFTLYSNRMLMDREKKTGQNILNSVSQNMEMQFAEIQNVKNAFYIHKEVFQEAEALNNPRLYAYYDKLTRVDIEKTYVTVLTKMIHSATQDVRAVVFYPASQGDEAYYLGKDYAELRTVEEKGYQTEEWYQKALEKKGEGFYYRPHLPDYMSSSRLGDVYSYISAIKDMNTNKVIGVVKIDITTALLMETVNRLDEVEDSGLMILQNDILFAKSDTLAGNMEMLEEDKVRIGEKSYSRQVMKIPDTDMELVYLNSHASLYQGYFYSLLLSLAIVLAGCGLAFVSYRHQAKKMVQDIKLILEGIRRVEKGELDTRIAVRSDSEFGKIAETINQMTGRLKEYIEKEFVLVIQQQRAEYKALQSQINPHFLYNTLNGFVALNRMGEKKILEKSILGLSRLFRYVCSSRDEVTIQEEIDFLEDYLKLEKLKYDERIDYLIWTEEECRDRKIPRLLLQPIVENSIRHGMGETDQPMMIQIFAGDVKVSGVGHLTVITVRDNGVGFDPAKVTGTEHVGMENVKKRAQIYRKNMIFQCVSQEGMGTKVTFVFPEER